VFIWKQQHKLLLVKETISLEPYAQKPSSNEVGKIWRQVADNLNAMGQGFEVTQRSCRNQFNTLMKDFRDKERDAKKASGTDETHSEIDELCQDIHDRMEELQQLQNEKNIADEKKEKKQKV